jgi:rhamnose utilization protein RhaD (predicted bifunctional aldolase and dehydrogenase)/NAD(P)-dependent dehydrogenase (short-subunit alcohol dehydrogenase family)
MQNRWNDAEALAAVERYGAAGVPEELALRVYSSRLIGSDPALVLHGGGNTSVKGHAPDALGAPVPVLYVKGSGWDLATIEPAGFPAVRLEPLRALRRVPAMSDEGMVNALRTNLLDASAPNPSVEALLHAFLPHRFVDHTHADAILALVDQPDPEARCRQVFGDKLAVLDFVFPGFPLAGIAMEAYERDPAVEGIVLVKHGLFTFGETARESYARMIAHVQAAEDALAAAAKANGRKVFAARGGLHAPDEAQLAAAAGALRGALATAEERAPGGWQRMLLHFRTSPAIRAFVDGAALADYARRGVITPDHIIRTKNLPLVLPPLSGPGEAAVAALGAAAREGVAAYADEYRAYFDAGVRGTGQARTLLDPLPRVLLLPGAGLFAAGATEKDARIAADLYEHTVTVIAQAEAYGRYTPLEPLALFEMEYWSLEQAKLGKGAEKPLARHVALVTGAASGIGAATARAFAAQGAHLALLDTDAARLAEVAQACGKLGVSAAALPCDVTDAVQVGAAFQAAALRFGGVDIVVSNAGKVWQGPMAEVDPAELRASFELNFFAHQLVAAEAVRVFRRQGTGGQLLFNASKSAFNPGPNLGPYTLPKAAVVALMKQYALDYAELGVRSNAVNADRVPTALFGEGVLEQRAAARGVSVDEYLSGNLLHRPVRAEDVADAFVMLARAERTTGAVLPVDGGNIAASPR